MSVTNISPTSDFTIHVGAHYSDRVYDLAEVSRELFEGPTFEWTPTGSRRDHAIFYPAEDTGITAGIAFSCNLPFGPCQPHAVVIDGTAITLYQRVDKSFGAPT